MPTYEYACRTCGEHLEVVQNFRDDALTECPACQGQLRKVFSAAGIIFKGSGWHVKDYSSASSRAASGPSGSSSGDAGAKGSDSSSATDSAAASTSSSSSSEAASA
jgi:putative FmdB family regulatory protein